MRSTGDVGRALLQGRSEQARRALDAWLELFGDRYYLEVQRIGAPGEDLYVPAALALAAAHGVPPVATNDVRFLQPTDFEAHEARVCIHEGTLLADPSRPRRYTPQQFLRTPQQMAALFAEAPAALANSVEIARRCSLVLRLGEARLPVFPGAAGLDARSSTCNWPRSGACKRAWRPRRSRRRTRSAIGERLRAGTGGDLPDGLCQLLPHRRRFHRLGARQRGAGGAGTRLGSRLAGGLRAGHHRHRPAALRPAVRALPQSRARVDAGFRHRLLHGRARSRDRLRRRQVRRGAGLADHHLRHARGQGGGARCGPRARASRTAWSIASPSWCPSSSR